MPFARDLPSQIRSAGLMGPMNPWCQPGKLAVGPIFPSIVPGGFVVIYVRWFPGDYLRDTTHLTCLEDCAYRRLLDLYYTTGGPLTTDREKLYRQLRMTAKEEKQAVERVIAEFFFERRHKLFNSRASKELQRSREISSLRAKAAKQKVKTVAIAKQMHSKSFAIPEPELYPHPELEPDEEAEASGPLAVAVSAFSFLGCNVPFGSEQFQIIVAEELLAVTGTYNSSNNGVVDAMERVIQRCKSKNIRVPGRWYTLKREIEKVEAINMFKSRPL